MALWPQRSACIGRIGIDGSDDLNRGLLSHQLAQPGAGRILAHSLEISGEESPIF
jgi:hypothetical protein